MKTIRLFATLRDLVGASQIEIPFQGGQTVRQLLNSLEEPYPELIRKILDEKGELTGLVHIMVHGRNIMWLDGLDTAIQESDHLVMVPPMAGG